jgi:outer membrane immunogenic protein
MRSFFSRMVSVLVLSLAVAGGAQAADGFYSPTPSGVYDWSGVYGGAAIGTAWSSFTTQYGPVSPQPFDFSAQGFTFGVLGGVMAQMNSFVFGLEADVNFTSLDDTRIIQGNPISAEADWFASLRGRAGYAFDNFLVYGTGGLATGRIELSVPGAATRSRELGWTLGGGVEVALTENFTARAEYLYTDFGRTTGTLAGSPFSTEFDSHAIRAGIIYRFR